MGLCFFLMSFSTCRNSKFHEVVIHFRLLRKVCAAVQFVILLFNHARLNEYTGDM